MLRITAIAVIGLLVAGWMVMAGCSKQETPQAQPEKTGTATQTTETVAQVKDPVCGMAVGTDSQHKASFEEKTYYFCSAACLDKFLQNPGSYITQ